MISIPRSLRHRVPTRLVRGVAVAATVAMLVACGSDDDASSDAPTTSPGTESPGTESPGTASPGAESPTTGSTDGADAATTNTVVTETVAAVGTAQDPAIAALVLLDKEGVCALIPAADVEAIAGPISGEPFGTNIEGLGTNCIYYGGDGFTTLAKLEFQALPWVSAASLAQASIGDAPVAEPCTIGGREALCTPAYEAGGITIGATVLVKLGSDDDAPMLVESDLGPDTAAAVAELALANIGI